MQHEQHSNESGCQRYFVNIELWSFSFRRIYTETMDLAGRISLLGAEAEMMDGGVVKFSGMMKFR